MGINFKVSMVLEAVNRMEGGIRSAMQSSNRLRNSFMQTARETSRLNPVRGWSEKIAAAGRRLDEFGKKAESIQDKADKMMMDGMKGIGTGVAVAAPVLGSVQQAANLQTRFTTMGVMGMSEEGRAKVKEQSLQYAKNLAFDLDQVVSVAQSLQKAGMNERKVLQAQKYFTDYAQLEYNRYGSDPTQTATHLAHIGEAAGVFTVSRDERNKYNLRTEMDIEGYVQNKIASMTDTLNRVVSVTSADTATYAETLKYAMPQGRANKMSNEDTMMMAGIYSRFGIEGSMAGTHMKDFIGRLNPYQHYMDEDVAKRSNRLSAMQAAGWLDGAQWTTTKTGYKKFTSAGKSVFHNEDASMKSPDKVFAKIFEAFQKFENEGKSLQFNGILHDVFGEQGEDIAKLMNTDPEMFEKMQADMDKVMTQEKALAAYQNDVNTQWDIFKGNIVTAGTLLGETLSKDTSKNLKGWNEKLFGNADTASPVATWIGENKELVGTVMKGTLAFAGMTAGIGILKIVGAGINFALVAPLMTMCGWLGKGISIGGNLKAGFDLFRATGAGGFKSIIKGAELAYPWLGKLTGWVTKFTPFWLSNAARIAAGWLIAMGPVGWAIGAVTLIIGAAVLAWNSNFLGFRDTVTEAWSWIKDYAEYICPGISKTFKEMTDKAANEWTYVKNEASSALSAMQNEVNWVCNAMGIDFDGVTGKVRNFIQTLWDSQPAVMAYNGISSHFQGFERWRERGKNMEQRDLLAQPEYIIPNIDGTSSNFNQTNNITLPDTSLAADFIKKSIPDKYSLANPEFNI